MDAETRALDGRTLVAIPVGETWTIQPTRMDGTPFGDVIDHGEAGSIDTARAQPAS